MGQVGLAMPTALVPQKPHLNLVVEAEPLSVQLQHRGHKSRRRGRIAMLPKLQRDMVNRMIWNGVPYKNIVLALDELDFQVTERNISNWATGGYIEWQFQQDLVTQSRLDQDDLLDRLRRDDASELPEVGLQAAATRISQILVEKTATGQNIEANLGTFSQMVDVLCRLNREIGLLQKQRDDSRRALGRHQDPSRIKESDQESALETERHYSDPPEDTELSKPAEPPLLPPRSTSSFLQQCDSEAEEAKQTRRHTAFIATLKALNGQKSSTAPGSGRELQPHPHPPAKPAEKDTNT